MRAIRSASRSTCVNRAAGTCSSHSSIAPTSWWRTFGPAHWRNGTSATTFYGNVTLGSSWSGCPATARPDRTPAKAGYASVAEAVSGLRHMNGFPRGRHRGWHCLWGHPCGMFAAQAHWPHCIGAASRARPVVDAALTEACLAVQESTIPDYDVGGVVRGPSGTRLEGIAPSNIYRSADGSWVVVAANQDTVFRRLCQAMGQPELAEDPRFVDHGSRGRNQDELDVIIGGWAAARQPQDIIDTLSAAGVIAGPINTVAEVVTDPQFRARGMLVEHFDERIGRNVLGPGVVPVLSATPGGVRNAGPARPGQHNNEIYGELLGLKHDELATLAQQGVI